MTSLWQPNKYIAGLKAFSSKWMVFQSTA